MPLKAGKSGKLRGSSAQRVSIFVSHRTAIHKVAAERIKSLLESRTERLDVQICESIIAGDNWRKWIKQRIAASTILLVLVPEHEQDLAWIEEEVRLFKKACQGGRMVVLKPAAHPIPDFADSLEIIEASKENLRERFLKPLLLETTLTALQTPLNPRISDMELERDADEMEDAIAGLLGVRKHWFGESLIIDTSCCNVHDSLELGCAVVRAPNGCSQILKWDRENFSFAELRARALENKGKGTFWVTEMEQVMTEVARHDTPRVMSSTFRGRGEAAGRIFRPHLERVDSVGNRPVRFYFVFHEVLVPELVRGPGPIGAVSNLLHLASRVRWEVLNPFLVKRSSTPSEEDREDLMSRVISSLRVIDLEAERHNILEDGLGVFDENGHGGVIREMFDDRAHIKSAIEAAGRDNNFEQLMKELVEALDLNSKVTEILAAKFLELMHADRAEVQKMVARYRATGRQAATAR